MHEIPGYTALEPIGSGGTATVYKARQEVIGREVAIKVLAAPSLDARSEKRFSRETKALGALGWHPNIVVLFDAGQTVDGIHYIAMEHLGGGSLADAGRLPPEEVCAVGVKIAGALQCAHDAGVLHRDVKPGNILRSVFGEAKLADFGISGLVDATHTTGGGMTLAHVSPEVVDGRQATTASDVYSLASTLYELAVGTPPFTVERHEEMVSLLLKIMDAPVPDPRLAGVPDALAEVLESGLAKDPQSRPDAAAFGAALSAVQAEQGWPVTPLPVPPVQPGGAARPGHAAGRTPGDRGRGGVADTQTTIEFDTPPPSA